MEREYTQGGVDSNGTITTGSAPTPPPTGSVSEPSIGELFSELSTDMSTLVRKEIELARAETSEKISRIVKSAVVLVAGGLIAYAGLIVLLIAAAILLGAIMPYWLSSLAVGLAVIIIGAIMIVSGKNTIENTSVVPKKTMDTLKEDARWAKEQVS